MVNLPATADGDPDCGLKTNGNVARAARLARTASWSDAPLEPSAEGQGLARITPWGLNRSEIGSARHDPHPIIRSKSGAKKRPVQ
jgi:hypothetical protein